MKMKIKFKKRKTIKIRKIARIQLFVSIVIFSVALISIAVAQVGTGDYSSSASYQVVGAPVQYYEPGFVSSAGYISPSVYWPEFDKETCKERQDFIVQVAPGGCEPAVVRSDLLEERNVPVFCKLMLIQTNPLIDVSRVKSIIFPGKTPEGVSSIGYFPSRFNIEGYIRDLADTPIDDNMGYFVIVLQQQKSEKEMPDWVGGNLTAVINYDVESALGIGKTSFYVSELSSEDWLRDYKQYSFWNGKGYIKTESIESDRVTVSVYRDFDTKQATLTLKKGETSSPIYLSGFYCAAGLKVKLEAIQIPVEAALLQVDNQLLWVARGDRILDDRCRVEEVDASTRKVSISCNVQNGRFDLSLSPSKVKLQIGESTDKLGAEQEYSIESSIKDNIYLGYVGIWQKQGEKEKKKFVVLVSDPWSETKSEFEDKGVYSIVDKIVTAKQNTALTFEKLTEKIKEGIKNEYKRKVKTDLKDEQVDVLVEGNAAQDIKKYAIENKEVKENKTYSIKLSEVEEIANKDWSGSEQEKLAKDYYDKAVKSYNDLVELYPNEKKIEEDYFEPYAAEGLFEAAELAKIFEMKEDRNEFLSRLRREYPDSDFVNSVVGRSLFENKYDSKQAGAVVNLKDRSYFVEVLDFKKPNEDELSVDLLIKGESEKLGLDEIFNLDKGSIQVTEIEDDYVTLKYTKSSLNDSRTSILSNIKLDLDKHKQEDLDGTTIKLSKINLKKQAKLVLDSEVKGPMAYANFSFKIGIEKRGIKLSPEKTKEMIENLDKSIKDWENINEKLGKVVKGLKGACFATSAILTIKNLFEGFSGKSMARKEVMTKTRGWNDYCERIVSSGEKALNGNVYSSVQKCLLDYNSQIEKDVEILANKIEETNKNVESVTKVEKTGVLDIEGQVKNRLEMEENFRKSVEGECKECSGELGDLKSYPQFCTEGSFEDIKEIVTMCRAWKAGLSSVSIDALRNDSARIARSAQQNYAWEQARKIAAEETKKLGMELTSLEGDKIVYGDIHLAKEGENFVSKEKVSVGESIVAISVPTGFSEKTKEGGKSYDIGDLGGHPVLVEVSDENKDGIYTVTSDSSIYNKDGTKLETNSSEYKAVREYLSENKATQFKQSDAKAYKNKMINPDKLLVKYFDRVPYKGLPAEIPFDVEEGWYVELEYVLSGFGKPYDESGRAINYYICNVGENGLIEFKRKADDICRYYNGVSDELGFPGMSVSESKKLVARARNAIAEASKYYGKKEAIINGRKFSTGISFGGEAGQCSDFMSPSDCYIMFNLCDPVICPSSRCDLGGEFPVDNVIQTGIIGSLVLCLPNIKEGIIIPVCLSGVYAGIDSYVSILKAHRDCLNESLETGRNVGICDEIKSIYLCEFFWRQLVPFADVLIPKIVESFFNQGARGGGEYATVQAAWDNTQSAIDYFKNDYAVNSMKAFTMRSTEEAGTEVCKSFISARYPTNFDLLTEPDSPVQYHAWFDENVMTTATPYPTSHYKVYYHIYAGKDQGAYYYVYLKDISEEFSSYYTYTPGHYVVWRGYIPRGGYVDEARDFIAPSGYKQLCVNINGQDECGFGKVSTSFAIDYLSDMYAEEQAKQQITTSKECVAGSPSLSSMAQPNLQAGAEEVVEPELYNQGIVRVCSTYNPGKQVDAKGEYDTTNSTFDRWKDVGYCDDPTLRCWLDTDSVKTVIQNKELEEGVLKEVDTSVIGKGYLTHEESREIANKAEDFIGSLKIEEVDKGKIENNIGTYVNELSELSNYGPSNSFRSRGLLLLGNLYGKVAKEIKPVEKVVSGSGGESEGQILKNTEGEIIYEEKEEERKENGVTYQDIIADYTDYWGEVKVDDSDYKKAIYTEKSSCCGEKVSYNAILKSPITYSFEDCEEERIANMKAAMAFIQREASNNLIEFAGDSKEPVIKIKCEDGNGKVAGETDRSISWEQSQDRTKDKGNIFDVKITFYKDFPSRGVAEMHELLHVFGFQHVDSQESIMYVNAWEGGCCEISSGKALVDVGDDIIDKLKNLYENVVTAEGGKTETITYKEGQIFKYDMFYLKYSLNNNIINIGIAVVDFLPGVDINYYKDWYYTTDSPNVKQKWYSVEMTNVEKLSFLKGKNFQDGVKEILDGKGQAYNKP